MTGRLSGVCLQRAAFQLFDVGIDAAQFARDRDALWAVFEALLARYAMAGLTDGRDGPVVAHKVGPAQLAVVFLLSALGDLALVDTCVVVLEYSRNVHTEIGRAHV